MDRYPHLRPYLLLIAAMAFWGMTFVWVKIALEAFQPVTILLLRLCISSLILLVLMRVFRKFQQIDRQDFKLFALSALFQPFFYFIGETYGLSYVSSALGAIMISTIPVFTPIGSWFFFRERLGWKNLAGFVFSFAGVLLMVSGEEDSGSTSMNGIMFLIFAVFAAIANAITVKKLTVKYNSFTIVTLQNVFGILYFIPLFFVIDYPTIGEVTADFRIWRNVIALAVFGSTLAFVFFTSSLRTLGINRTTIFSNFIPVFTALFAFLILGEEFPLIKIAGMAIVIAGVLVVGRGSRVVTSGA
jgi:drug/metabolite transporter (DMT)-like permease